MLAYRSLRSALPNFALAAGSILTFLLIAEGALRFRGVDLTVPALEIRHGGRNQVAWAFTDAHFVRDHELMWAPRRSFAPFNEQGYRGAPVAVPKPPGELRLLAVGDSNTLGHAASWANDLATTFDPRVLGRERTTVVNASVYGYSSYQGRLRLERFRNFQPDLVLISFGGNDAGPNFASDRALPRPSAWDRFLDRWSSRLRVMALVRYAAYRLADRSGAPRSVEATSVPRVSVEEYRENLRAMIDQSRRMGARPVLFTRPFAYDEYAAGRKSSLRGYYQATLDVGAAEKVSVVDLHRMMGCHWSLYQDHAHFNARGHAVAASLVAQALLAVLTRGTYDVDVVRYRPEDGPYESLLDQLRTKVHLWVAEPQARLALREAAGGRSLHTLFDLASPPPSPTWRLANATDSLEMGVGRLCVTSSSGSPALVLDVPPDPDGYLFLWLELDGHVEVGIQVYWDTGAGFSENDTATEAFSVSFAQRPYRFSHLLPRGVRRVRLDPRPTVPPGPVCLRHLWLERVGANDPRDAVTAAAR